MVLDANGEIVPGKYRRPKEFSTTSTSSVPSYRRTTETRKNEEGAVFTTVYEDHSKQPTAVAKEAGIGVDVDGSGAKVDR